MQRNQASVHTHLAKIDRIVNFLHLAFILNRDVRAAKETNMLRPGFRAPFPGQ